MRIFIVAFLLVISTSITESFAQKWVDIGLKGEWGANFMWNKNIMDDQKFNHKLVSGFGIGGKLGFNLSENHEITFDVIWSRYNQKFAFNKVLDSSSAAQTSFEKSFRFHSIDLIPMYRMNKEGNYVEIGPQFSLIGDKITGTNTFDETENAKVPDYINRKQIGLVFGAGNYMLGTENFGITLGIRFKYMFTDLISETGQNEGYPSETAYSAYKASHAFSAMLVTEANYDLGYLAKAKCSKRRKIIFF